MRYVKVTLFCAQCNRPTVHRLSTMTTGLHVLACVLTCGLWIPVWLIWRARNAGAPVCTRCDTKQLPQPRSL